MSESNNTEFTSRTRQEGETIANYPAKQMTFETWRKMGQTKQWAYQRACDHKHTIVDDGLPICERCASIGPWANHPIHGHFPNGQPVA